MGDAEIVKSGAATTIEIVLETLARFALFPAKLAVTAYVPAAANENGSVAIPLVRGTVPNDVDAVMNVTFPDGLNPVTVAVKLSCWF